MSSSPRIRFRFRFPSVLVLVVGLVLGWGLAGLRPHELRAGGGDRSGESIITTGPVLVRYDEGSKLQVAQEALYFLDYKAGKLMGTIPAFHQVIGAAKIGTNQYIDKFAERDLVTDFKIDLDNGPRPRFAMTTGSLGSYSGGWSPLYVFETTTSQLAIYKIQQQSIGTATVPKFELVELRPYAKAEGQAIRP